jgi:fructoselysine-6-P-deglycase FrlB-like protein
MALMTQTEIELATQPAILRQIKDFLPEVAHKLAKRGEKIAAIGCGSSWFMSMAAAGFREAAGDGETDVYAGSEFLYQRHYDRLVVITRSGTTSEIVELLKRTKLPSVVITAVPDSPVTEFATESIIMDFADEQSVVQTRWATAALGLLRAHNGADLEKIADDCEIALQEDISSFTKLDQITFLGRGWTIGLAQEAGLKTREAAQFWSEAYPAFDYRHGPMSIAQEGRGVWMFGELDKYLEADIKKTGALLEKSTLDPMAHLVKAHRVCVALAKHKGLDPDNPRGLTRSIILDHAV